MLENVQGILEVKHAHAMRNQFTIINTYKEVGNHQPPFLPIRGLVVAKPFFAKQ